jgi:PLP dependent protein
LAYEILPKATAKDPLSELSMGMSHDFDLAIAAGATLLRIGSRLFEGLI